MKAAEDFDWHRIPFVLEAFMKSLISIRLVVCIINIARSKEKTIFKCVQMIHITGPISFWLVISFF